MPRSLSLLLILLVVVACGGAQCVPRRWPTAARAPEAPRLLPENPTLEQVVGVVNANTQQVYSYSTANARITSPGVPALRANIALERPRRFRLRAETALTGLEVDLGSNDEQFWFWARRAQPPSIYFCRHDQFAASPIRQLIPIDPQWLIEALGFTSFDPRADHAGPVLVRGNRLEVRSRLMAPEGEMVKVTVVDAHRGWVLEQHVYTAQGERLASALASGHRYHPQANASLPSAVEVQLPASQVQLKIDLGDYQLNNLTGDPAQLWARPVYPGYSEVDLGRPFTPPPNQEPLLPANRPVYRLPPQ